MWLIGLLLLVATAGMIYGLYLMRQAEQSTLFTRIQQLERNAAQHGGARGEAQAKVRAASGGSKLSRFLPGQLIASYDERLLWVGRPYGLTGEQLASLKLILALALPALVPVLFLFQFGGNTTMAMFFVGVLGFMLPDLWLTGRLADRKRQVSEELPLFTDLVATAISAGLSLSEAVRRVAADAPGLVAREFLRTVQEMAAGKPRVQAWQDLTARLPGDELRTIVNAIMQAEQYGTSVAEILRYQVQQIRTMKQQDAQRIAQSVTVKMRIPMHILEVQPREVTHLWQHVSPPRRWQSISGGRRRTRGRGIPWRFSGSPAGTTACRRAGRCGRI